MLNLTASELYLELVARTKGYSEFADKTKFILEALRMKSGIMYQKFMLKHYRALIQQEGS